MAEGWDFLNNIISSAAKVGEAAFSQPQPSTGAEYTQQPGAAPTQPQTVSNPVPENPAGPLGLPLAVAGIRTEYIIVGAALLLGVAILVRS